jgi:CMP/dCMP kinase
MIIVIDGPSGSGKSTLAEKLSKDLKIPYFDTGAMYRSFCWFLLKNNISDDNENEIKECLNKMDFRIVTTGDNLRYLVNGEDVTDAIREENVTKHVSKVSAYLFVREHLVSIQRAFGKSNHGIFEGRDMGSVVFPNAEVKFFLYADPNIRALRRFEQLQGKFPGKQFEKEKVLHELNKRDEFDTMRQYSPLMQAKDAISIDVSHLSIEEVFEEMKSHIKEKMS